VCLVGDVIPITVARGRRTPAGGGPAPGHRLAVRFAFDLALPETYLAVERLGRLLDRVAWTPALAAAVTGGGEAGTPLPSTRQETIEARAETLRMPLVWPERFPFDATAAMRIAFLAVDLGRGGEFVLAASRLAFCGGFDLEDFEVLAEAAAAAGLPLDACLSAAGDHSVDAAIQASALALRARGASRLPVMTVGTRMFCGEERLAEAAAFARVSLRSPRAG
jgi:2-hydroxychromene-2-carboxylate isomerase